MVSFPGWGLWSDCVSAFPALCDAGSVSLTCGSKPLRVWISYRSNSSMCTRGAPAGRRDFRSLLCHHLCWPLDTFILRKKGNKLQIIIWLALGQHRLELHKSTYMRNFKINTYYSTPQSAVGVNPRVWNLTKPWRLCVGFHLHGGWPPTPALFKVNCTAHQIGSHTSLFGAVIVPGCCILWLK